MADLSAEIFSCNLPMIKVSILLYFPYCRFEMIDIYRVEMKNGTKKIFPERNRQRLWNFTSECNATLLGGCNKHHFCRYRQKRGYMKYITNVFQFQFQL